MPFGRRKSTTQANEPVRRFEFVGREAETKAVLDNFHLPADAPNKKPIIGIHGVGGVGKTRFLQHITQKLPGECIVSYVDETDDIADDVGRLINTICRNARKAGKPVQFDKTNALINLRITSLNHLRTEKDELPQSVFGFIYAGARLAISGTPVASVLDALDVKEKVEEAATVLSNRFLEKQNLKVEQALLFEPKPILTNAFVEDLNRLAGKNNSIVLIFDTFEVIGSIVNPWLLKWLIGEARDNINCNLHILIAGRAPLTKTDQGWFPWQRDDLICEIELEPFTDDEIIKYLEVNCEQSNVSIQELAQITTRLPLWLDLWSLSEHSIAEYRSNVDLQNITDRVLKFLPSDKHRNWVKKAALCRWFDGDVLAALLEDPGPAFDWLVSQSSMVKGTSKGKWKLHDALQEILQKYQLAYSQAEWDYLNKSLANHIFKKADSISQQISSLFLQYFDDEWQDAVEDFFVYGLRVIQVDKKTRSRMAGILLESMNYDIPFFYKISDLIDHDERELLPNLRFLWLNIEYDAFSSQLTSLVEECELPARQKAIAYNWIGYQARLKGNLQEALEWNKRAADIYDGLASIHYDTADILRHLGYIKMAKDEETQGRLHLHDELYALLKSKAFDQFQSTFASETSMATAAINFYYAGELDETGKTRLSADILQFAKKDNTEFLLERSKRNYTKAILTNQKVSLIRKQPFPKSNKKKKSRRK
jgi:hypothetical protein